MRKQAALIIILEFTAASGLALSTSGCATMRSLFAMEDKPARNPPISNPFDPSSVQSSNRDNNVVLRSKRGDRSVEVELPARDAGMTDLVMPVNGAFKNDYGPDSSNQGGVVMNGIDERYREKAPGISDREITQNFSASTAGDETKRREVESGLGVTPSDEEPGQSDHSYLASMDHVKQLYKGARYEAALLELDDLVRVYPTDAKLYEMRGTLLDRLGKSDLAFKSWNQALRLNPKNETLKRFVDRREQKRGLASP